MVTRRPTVELAIGRADLSERRGSLPHALATAIRSMITRHSVKPGGRLPPTRELAKQLGVARNVVTDAYAILAAEGLVEGQASIGTLILPSGFPPDFDKRGRRAATQRLPPRSVSAPSTQRLLLEPCVPDATFLGEPAWRSCWRNGLRHRQPAEAQAWAGKPTLGHEIARHLARSRGLDVDAERIVITNGALEAIHLTAMALLHHGDRVAVEDPGWPLARHALAARGFDIVALPVDRDGLVVERLQDIRHPPRLVVVTPAHQFPVGGRLPASRRQALRNWASQHDGWIIEDDYDSEFRFDVPPLPSLASMSDDDRVIHVGSFSKTLTPDLRVGYIVAQDRLVDTIRRLKLLLNCHTSTFEQAAIARFMAEGFFDRHLTKMRRLYSARRSKLVEVLKSASADGEVLGVDAGLHVYWSLQCEREVRTLHDKLAASGHQLASVKAYAKEPRPWLGFIAGFSSSSFDQELSQLNAALLQ